MPGTTLKIPASAGGSFDCYLALPAAGEAKQVPAVVLAAAIHGVDKDLRDIADTFAARGYIAAAPDLFWRTHPGPLTRAEQKVAAERANPRPQRIKESEADMADTLAALRRQPLFNGRAVAMGFCFGGPYAMIGPKRLGYAGGVSCHGSRMQEYIGELDGNDKPVCIIWGDQDNQAPPDVMAMFRAAADKHPSVELDIFPGIQHAYMMPDAGAAYDKATREFSFERTFAMLHKFRGA